MLRTAYLCGAGALLLAIPFQSPAAEPVTETNRILEELAKLNTNFNTRLDQLERSITKTKNDMASFDERLNRLQRDAVTNDDLCGIRNQIAQLQRDLDGLRGQAGTVRESLKPAPGTGSQPSTSRSVAPMGAFQITSEYAFPAEVLVNGQRHLVMPGEFLSFPLPESQPFTYQVIGRDPAPRIKNLTPGKPFAVRLFNAQ